VKQRLAHARQSPSSSSLAQAVAHSDGPLSIARVGEHQGTSTVLLDPKVEFRRPCSALAMAAATQVCVSALLKLHGGSPGGAFIGH
jgi:hypothetical protein